MLELEERKERRWEAEVPRQSGPEPWLEPPSYLTRPRDVTYANGADQMTRWSIFNFLRANGKGEPRCQRSGGSRPKEGDGAIFRRPKKLCQDCELEILKQFSKFYQLKLDLILIIKGLSFGSWPVLVYLEENPKLHLRVLLQRGSRSRGLIYKVVFLNGDTAPPLMVKQQHGKKKSGFQFFVFFEKLTQELNSTCFSVSSH